MNQLYKDYHIHLNSSFTEQKIVLHDLKRKKSYTPEVQTLIEKEWKTVLQDDNTYIFNGAISCLADYEVKDEQLHIYYQESDYKSYYGTNVRNSKRLEKSDLAYALAVCTVVETADKRLVVGKRGAHLAEGTSKWSIPGGAIEYYPDHENHPFDVMRRELEEELNLTAISSMVCIGLGENLILKKPEFLLLTKTELTSQQIMETIAEAPDYNEHSEIKFIPTKQITEFVTTHDFTEIGTAAIQLYLEIRELD